MLVEQMTTNDAAAVDWVPQLIYSKPIESFERPNLKIYSDCDDLDEYKGIDFRLDGLQTSIRFYYGFPEDCVTVYFERGYDDHEYLKIIDQKLRTLFVLTEADLYWARWQGLPSFEATSTPA